MTRRESYETRAAELIAPVLEENGFELVDMEYVREAGEWYLRAYVDKPGGITINDCELVSRYLSDRLDEEDFIGEAYILEVSSPGLDRPLKKDKDFQRHLGDEVEIRLFAPIVLPERREAEEAAQAGSGEDQAAQGKNPEGEAARKENGNKASADRKNGGKKGGGKKAQRRREEAVKELTGILRMFDEKTVTIALPEGEEMVLERDKIALIRLAFDF